LTDAERHQDAVARVEAAIAHLRYGVEGERITLTEGIDYAMTLLQIAREREEGPYESLLQERD
jgi:hypothetical protein